MSRVVTEAARSLRRALMELDPQCLAGADAAQLAEDLARTENACAAARLLASSRAIACGAHKEAGVADPAAWLARQGGTTGKDARQCLELARRLEEHPGTKEALLAGEVSVSQAQEITRAAPTLPGEEDELLALAKRGDLTRLRDEVRARRFQSVSREDLHARQVAARRFRHWRDGLGMVCFDGALPPETGIPFVTSIERAAARLHRQAKANGRPEVFCAHAADALLDHVAQTGTGSRRGSRSDLVIVCDLYAWRRGHPHDTEPCHLVGGGPIPVALARELADDAFLKVVLHDGKDISKVHHLGRRYTAELLTALNLGPVPSFSGRECARCKGTWHLEFDHDVPIAKTGPTTYENLKTLCYACHLEKTERDLKAGLLGRAAKARGPRARVLSRGKTQSPGATARKKPKPTPKPTPRARARPSPPSRSPARRAPPKETPP